MPQDGVKFLTSDSLKGTCPAKRRWKKKQSICHVPLSVLARLGCLGQSTTRWSYFSGGHWDSQDCRVLVCRQGAVHFSDGPALQLSAPIERKHHIAAFRSFSPSCSFPSLTSWGSEGHREMWISPSGWNAQGAEAFPAVCLLGWHSHNCLQLRKPGAPHLTTLLALPLCIDLSTFAHCGNKHIISRIKNKLVTAKLGCPAQ